MCTSHLPYDRAAFSIYTKIDSLVDLGADSTAKIIGQGDVVVKVQMNGKSSKCTIKNVKYAPALRYQLLSVMSMARLVVRTSFDDKGAVLTRKSNCELLAKGSTVSNLYALDIVSVSSQSYTALLANLDLWHQRLAHGISDGIREVVNRGVVKSIVLDPKEKTHNCSGRILGKGHRAAIPRESHSRTKQIRDSVNSHVLGPFQLASVGGSKYAITFVDDYSNWTVMYTILKKSEALNRFKQ